MTVVNRDSSINRFFPEYKLFIFISLIFLDIGVLFGGLNAFRVGGYLNVPEIHQTHWTSTLFGGVSLLLFAQIFAIFSHVLGSAPKYHKFTLGVLGLWIIGALSNYLIVWSSNPDLFYNVSEWVFKIAAVIFLVIIISIYFENGFKEKLSQHPSAYLLFFAILWFLFAIIFFDMSKGSLDRVFLTSYVYGFFSLSLFGILAYTFPRIFGVRSRSVFSLKLDMVLINVAAFLMVFYDAIRSKWLRNHFNINLNEDNWFFLGYIGPIIWGIAGLIFTLWLFDLVYKAGIQTSLVGALIAFIMFGFFVFDTFMKNAFPAWVTSSHVHFMFLGTIMITIASLGSEFIIRDSSRPNWTKFNLIAVGLVVAHVGMILLSFTLVKWAIAGSVGLSLFIVLLILETTYLIKSKNESNKKSD